VDVQNFAANFLLKIIDKKKMTNLTGCADCENKISKNASMCPHCGAPTKKFIEERIELRSKIASFVSHVLIIYLSYQGYT
jgi:predicted amidophosphoribosyltransferase